MPYIDVWVDDFDDDELIVELRERGYFVGGKLHDDNRGLLALYTTYTTMPKQFFEKELKRYFRDHLGISEY